ncbi:MAG TPA: bifunctional precorrin-2 dehydrogenase/sirohydrochlorin ferrochelatase [Pyrinomonadaceae bacterium]|nr:bifunctional precorrin-2 dehydrogenase/sirohydrochlorin ferrochelatase [Pyrinomonadaceae bacterium]
MLLYPIFLNLKSRRVVVIGGGEVAERKVRSLLDTGAAITVISPDLSSELMSLASAGRIDFQHRNYTPGDCKGASLVLSATDDPEVNRAVSAEARATGVLLNTADQPALCDFFMPAIVRRGDLTIAVSTGGSSPALAARLRDDIANVVGEEYGPLIELLAEVRPEIRRRVVHEADRKALYDQILRSDVLSLFRQHNPEEATRRLWMIVEDFVCEGKSS